MRVTLGIVITLMLLLLTSTAAVATSKQTQPIRAEQKIENLAKNAKSTKELAQLRSMAVGIGKLRSETWACQDTLHRGLGVGFARTKASQTVWALGPSLLYRHYVLQKWQRYAKSCNAQLTRRMIPSTNDWITAVNVAQRYYPGTKDRILFLSGREGGNGPWVWYAGSCGDPPCLWRGYHVGGDNVSGADTVGGWVQFRWSTFWPHWLETEANLRHRGFIIPEMKMPPAGGPVKYAPWLSPLGQALTVAYMHWSGTAGCHWCI